MRDRALPGLEDGTCIAPRRNAFDVMMASSASYATPPKTAETRTPETEGRTMIFLVKMKNDVIDWCTKHGAGWTPQSLESGEKVVRTLTGALWQLEPHRDKFEAQGAAIPKTFSNVQGI